MQRTTLKTHCALACVIAGILAIGPAIADKPSWAGGGKSDKSDHQGKGNNKKSERQDGDQRSRHESGGPQVKSQQYFGDRHRTIVHEYYSEQFRTGRCPPGLAKKNNGCMPPGQAKKWTIGRPLAREVIYYEVPQPLLVQFDRAPAGHRYVRVDSDILLLVLGTGMVIDAIQNLGRM